MCSLQLCTIEAVKKEKTYGIFHNCPDPGQPGRDMEKKKIKEEIKY
jgi:hypothetical protein